MTSKQKNLSYFELKYIELKGALITFKKRQSSCLCVIMHKPNPLWLKFLNDIHLYDVFVVIDDNEINYTKLYGNEYPNINFIQVDNRTCKKHGFINVNHVIKKLVTGWEKALLYFSRINKKYQNVWFMEDDVFINSENTLANIDSQYPNSDLLAKKPVQNQHCLDWTHWKRIKVSFPPPYFKTMVCATRMSKEMLSLINQYAEHNKTLFFLEALFPTLAKKYSIQYDSPSEMSTITWRRAWTEQEINSSQIFHPLTDIDSHLYYRAHLSQ